MSKTATAKTPTFDLNDERGLRDYLELLKRANDGRGYEAFVLEHGRVFKSQALPKRFKRGKLGLCFMNAAKLMQDTYAELYYVEGWASNIIPMHHAWVVDSDGNVIDPTWSEPESRVYFGVPFKQGYLTRVLVLSKTWGIFYKRETQELAENPLGEFDCIENFNGVK